MSEQHGKPSQTRWRVSAPSDGARTQVELEPVTGRSHQLRVHLKAIDHPTIGDALYGDAATAPSPRLLLHAMLLVFNHPSTGATVQFTSQPDFS